MSVRRAFAGAVVGTLLLLGPNLAGAAARQTVSGLVLVPTSVNCPFARAIAETSTRQGKLIAHTFTVDPSTRGGRFVLRPALPIADLDIWFDHGGHFAHTGLGGESGYVPLNATRAHVCLSVGSPVAFSYVATAA